MGCNQSSQQYQDASAPSPTASASPESKARPKLVKYRTLLTGQTVFDGGSKAASRANSRCTSHASIHSDEGSPATHSFALGDQPGQGAASQGFETDGSPLTDCSPAGRDCHFDPQMAEQAGGVTVQEMVLATKLASVAYAGGAKSTNDKYNQFVQTTVQAAVGMQSEQPLAELLKPLGLSLDRSFSYNDEVNVRGFIAYGESDLVLAYSAGLSQGPADPSSWAGTAEFTPLADSSGMGMGFLECCSAFNCAARAPQAHEAYLSGFNATIPDIEAAVLPRLRAKDKPVRLIVTGHGTGGAIATGALAYILKKVNLADTPNKLLYVSVGQPKFGDCVYRAWLEEEITRLAALGKDKCKFARLAHDQDPVPAGPAGMQTLVHVGPPHLLTQEGAMLLGEEALGSLEVKAAEMSAELRDMHQPAKYLELLNVQAREPAAAK